MSVRVAGRIAVWSHDRLAAQHGGSGSRRSGRNVVWPNNSLAQQSIGDPDMATSIHSLVVTITSAEILNCNSVAVDVVPAPGAGKFLALLSVAWQYRAGMTGYSSAYPDLFFPSYLDNPISDAPPSQIMGGTVSRILQGAAATGSALPVINEKIVLYARGANPTDGDGDLVVFVDYLIKTAH